MLRTTLAPLLWILFAACSVPHAVTPAGGIELNPAMLAALLVEADVIVLGEEHDSRGTHAAHQALLRELYILRPDLVISMEMFERDVQAALTQYLLGDIDEDEFLARARPWPNYRTDYRPVVEFAKRHKLEMIAANMPRELANKASKNGATSVMGSPMVATATTAPEDGYWLDFQKAMGNHGGTGESKKMQLFYESQCLKDDTMAESIIARLVELRKDGRQPLIVHICGRFHSDRGFGTVARLQQRMPALSVRVLSVTAPDMPVKQPPVAEFLFVVAGVDHEDEDEPKAKLDPHKPAAGGELDPHQLADPQKPAAPIAGAPAPTADLAPTGGRPALGVKPDYEFAGEGLRVEDVTKGGAAEAAGIKQGDVIQRVGADEVESVQGYMQVLQSLTPGQEIEVTLLRDGLLIKLKTKVGTRAGI